MCLQTLSVAVAAVGCVVSVFKKVDSVFLSVQLFICLPFYPLICPANPIRHFSDTTSVVWKALNLRGQLLADSRIITVSFLWMVSAAGEPKETGEKLACQDSAAASACPPAALPGHMKPPLSAKVRAEPHFGVKTEHMLIPISVSSNREEESTLLPKLTPVSSGCAGRFSRKTYLIAAGEKWKRERLSLTAVWSGGASEAHLLQNCFLFCVNHDVLELVS